MVRRAGARASRGGAAALVYDANARVRVEDLERAEHRRTEAELLRLTEDLERRVAERTREFERANAELGAANLEIAAANAELQNLLRDQERLQSELAYRALHDPLTGSPTGRCSRHAWTRHSVPANVAWP